MKELKGAEEETLQKLEDAMKVQCRLVLVGVIACGGALVVLLFLLSGRCG